MDVACVLWRKKKLDPHQVTLVEVTVDWPRWQGGLIIKLDKGGEERKGKRKGVELD